MEPHQLALAALSRVDQSTSIHRDTSAISSRPAAPRMINRVTGDDAARTLLPLEIPSAVNATLSQVGRAQDSHRYTNQIVNSREANSNSQSTTDGFDVASTPPTSTSDEFSSQSTNAEGSLSQLSQLSQVAAAQRPLYNNGVSRPILEIGSAAGQKRTADGEVKSASSTSPDRPRTGGHSRNASAVSNISTASTKIGELSSELRARLSYAMVKVNNGWESKTIAEVETLASQKVSPTSSASTIHGRCEPIMSPRTAIFASVQTKTNNSLPLARPPTVDFDLYSKTEPNMRTYEAFWHNHSATSNPTTRQSPNVRNTPPLLKPLAPPADIRSSPSSRRSATPKFTKPPTVPSHGSNSPFPDSAPHTPRQSQLRESSIRENGGIQTPSQKTIQEQDAIETLLFMSSPGNSNSMAHTFPPPRTQASPLQSPLRAEFTPHARGAQGRRVEFEAMATSHSPADAEYHGNSMLPSDLQDRSRSDAIDRLLDEMNDTSSDEDDLLMTYTTSPRRKLPAGRV